MPTLRVRMLMVAEEKRKKSFVFVFASVFVFVFVLFNIFQCSCLSVGGLWRWREKRKVIKTFLLLYVDKSQTDIQFLCKLPLLKSDHCIYMEKDAIL